MTPETTSLDILNKTIKDKHNEILQDVTGILNNHGISGYKISDLQFKLQAIKPIPTIRLDPEHGWWICCSWGGCNVCKEVKLWIRVVCDLIGGLIGGGVGILAGWIINYFARGPVSNIGFGFTAGCGTILGMWMMDKIISSEQTKGNRLLNFLAKQ